MTHRIYFPQLQYFLFIYIILMIHQNIMIVIIIILIIMQEEVKLCYKRNDNIPRKLLNSIDLNYNHSKK